MKMKIYTLTLLFNFILLSLGSAQISILFVDDTDDTFGNAEWLQDNLTSLGIAYDVFDAAGTVTSPTDTEMAAYDLVIWHASSDGVDLLFWNGVDEDNGNIISYLNGGGNLWVIGNDLFYDRYGFAPVDFEAGDFAYDYMGMTQFSVESYNDDGELGVPYVTPADGQPITGLDTVYWVFSTLWYADGATLRPEAIPIYEMDGDGYPLAGSVTGALYYDGNFSTLSFLFDLALALDEATAQMVLQSVVDYFTLLVSTDEVSGAASGLTAFPNPVAESCTIQFELEKAEDVSVTITNILGQPIGQVLNTTRLADGPHAFTWTPAATLPAGPYLLRVRVGEREMVQILQKQ
jgi:hypothetical protein